MKAVKFSFYYLLLFFSFALLLVSSCKKKGADVIVGPPTITTIAPASGPYNTVVTIDGSNFSTVASENIVKFNGVNAVVQAATSTRLTVMVPKGAGTGVVTVNVKNKSAIGPSFTYVLAEIVSTLAGSGVAGFADGTGTNAQFKDAFKIATDAQGNVYVADNGNNCIRKITPAGVVTTLAGSTSSGYQDGAGPSAKFSGPQGVAVDLNGNVYVADRFNSRIRKITPSGNVTTVAGSAVAGYLDGNGTNTMFNQPTDIAVDLTGNLYVADLGNERIRKINTSGNVTTLAGSTRGYLDAVGASAKFADPSGIITDLSGNVYVADAANDRIRKITPVGSVTTIAGDGNRDFLDAAGTAARFAFPIGLGIDKEGNIYVADQNNQRIRKITNAAVVSTFAGSGAAGWLDGVVLSAKFKYPRGVAADGQGNLYVVDASNNRIRKISFE